MRARVCVLIVSLALLAGVARAQPPQFAQEPMAPMPGHPGDPVREKLFPPELVMRHQKAIGLTPEQRTYLRDEIRRAQLQFTEMQWQLQDAMETVQALLEKSPVAEAEVLAQLDKVLEAERAIKRAQVALMVRVKNKLTPEQQEKLRQLRQRFEWPEPPSPPGPPRPPEPPE